MYTAAMSGTDPSLKPVDPELGLEPEVPDLADPEPPSAASWPRLVPADELSEDDTTSEPEQEPQPLTELEQLGRDLEDAQAEVARLAPFEQELQRVEALEDRITDLQQALLLREHEVAELQEKFDTEAARSYRLSQRRIPALNKEIETLTAQVREFERKLQKAELKLATVEERNLDLTAQIGSLQRDLQDTRNSARQTAVVRRAENNELADQLKRRLQESETERVRLVEALQSIGGRNKALLAEVSGRADRLEQEGDKHHAELLAARKDLKIQTDRLASIAQLVEDILQDSSTSHSPLLDAIRELSASSQGR
jgi:chromosome segregation ATPase